MQESGKVGFAPLTRGSERSKRVGWIFLKSPLKPTPPLAFGSRPPCQGAKLQLKDIYAGVK